jgi:hypothetical protein
LESETYAPPHGAGLWKADAEDLGRATRRAGEPQQATEGRCLSGAIGTDESRDLSLVDGQVQPFHGDGRAVCLL